MIKGGVYIYSTITTAPKGKLRLLYGCNPMAFIAEQAGGKASDGYNRIMEIIPTELHERAPFFVEITIWLKKWKISNSKPNIANTMAEKPLITNCHTKNRGCPKNSF